MKKVTKILVALTLTAFLGFTSPDVKAQATENTTTTTTDVDDDDMDDDDGDGGLAQHHACRGRQCGLCQQSCEF